MLIGWSDISLWIRPQEKGRKRRRWGGVQRQRLRVKSMNNDRGLVFPFIMCCLKRSENDLFWLNIYLCEVVFVTPCQGNANRVSVFQELMVFKTEVIIDIWYVSSLLSRICTPLPPQCPKAISYGLHWFKIIFFTISPWMDHVTKQLLDASSLNAVLLWWGIDSHHACLDHLGDSLNLSINLNSVYHGFGLLEKASSFSRQMIM